MKGPSLKATIVTVALCSAMLSTALTFAMNNRHHLDKTTMFNSGSGCMACHQSDTTPLDETLSKNQDNKRTQDPIATVPQIVSKGNALKKP